MTAYYLVGRYGRKDELLGYAQSLIALGHRVTAQWLWTPARIADNGLAPLPEAVARQRALEDWAHLAAAQVVLVFTETPGSPYTRGARHVELGLALAWAKQ